MATLIITLFLFISTLVKGHSLDWGFESTFSIISAYITFGYISYIVKTHKTGVSSIKIYINRNKNIPCSNTSVYIKITTVSILMSTWDRRTEYKWTYINNYNLQSDLIILTLNDGMQTKFIVRKNEMNENDCAILLDFLYKTVRKE